MLPAQLQASTSSRSSDARDPLGYEEKIVWSHRDKDGVPRGKPLPRFVGFACCRASRDVTFTFRIQVMFSPRQSRAESEALRRVSRSLSAASRQWQISATFPYQGILGEGSTRPTLAANHRLPRFCSFPCFGSQHLVFNSANSACLPRSRLMRTSTNSSCRAVKGTLRKAQRPAKHPRGTPAGEKSVKEYRGLALPNVTSVLAATTCWEDISGIRRRGRNIFEDESVEEVGKTTISVRGPDLDFWPLNVVRRYLQLQAEDPLPPKVLSALSSTLLPGRRQEARCNVV